ncbi:MAG: hypothetical protein KBC26_02495 [Candidatus Pacebacteria bacterium]|nr:hypothetical protein [Candidatus Paceibacterota bacterium]
MISYDDFSRVELRTARVMHAERVTGSDKLLRLDISVGDVDDAGSLITRQLVAGIGKNHEPEQLIGKMIIIVANLEPKMFRIKTEEGVVELESRGMLLAASNDTQGPVLLTTMEDIEGGSGVR